MNIEAQQKRIANITAHAGDDYAGRHGSMGVPIYQTSIFVETGDEEQTYRYSRGDNPTFRVGEKKLAEMEKGGDALLTSSGMSAITIAMLHCVRTGGHIVTLRNVYGGSRAQLNYFADHFGIETSYIDCTDVAGFEAAIRPNTQLIYLESPSTFLFEMQDVAEICKLAKHHGIKTMIDNTWATPLYQNPLESGVDLVVHSCSKYLGGHSDIIGGAVIGSQSDIAAMREIERLNFGCQMDPHQAYLAIRGMRTLTARMRQHTESAAKITRFLQKHPCVDRVLYPGLDDYPQKALAEKYLYGYSGLFSVLTKGNLKQAAGFVRDTKIFNRTVSWGGYDSLICGVGLDGEDKARENSIPQGLIRISVGLEAVDSLMEALDDSLRSNIPL